MSPPLHRAVDALAMWVEDRRARAPIPFREAPPAALDCFGPLDVPAYAPPRAGAWRAPSPRAAPGDAWTTVHALPARAARRGTLLLVPPWKVPTLAATNGYARLLARTGFDVWTLEPPRHLSRTAPGVRSGEGFVTPELPALRAAFEQLVLELRLLATLARRAGGEVGVVGLSLGALGAALAATAPEPLDFAALLAPPADLAAVFAGTAIGRRYLDLARRAGAPAPPRERLEELLAPFRPGARPPTARRVLVAVGREDRIALAPPALALARAWGAEARVYPRGHLTLLFACRALRRELGGWIAGGPGARGP
jgi:hypothetical protein